MVNALSRPMIVTITLTEIWHVRPRWWECFLRPIVLLALIVHLDEVARILDMEDGGVLL